MKESELFEPIRNYFTEQGYSGDGEVSGIDLYMEKDGLSTAVELKKTLDYRALQQAALDQRVCDFVYIGIFRPRDLHSRRVRDKLYLLKRLGIGLICVSPRTGRVELVNEPLVSELAHFQKAHRDRREAVKAEFQRRRIRDNTGGVNRTKLMTAYREEALLVLSCLGGLGGQGSCRQIREGTQLPNSTSILHDNHYGWFENVSRGVYRITEQGYGALSEYGGIIGKMEERG